jgi:hypothetical protein
VSRAFYILFRRLSRGLARTDSERPPVSSSGETREISWIRAVWTPAARRYKRAEEGISFAAWSSIPITRHAAESPAKPDKAYHPYNS